MDRKENEKLFLYHNYKVGRNISPEKKILLCNNYSIQRGF